MSISSRENNGGTVAANSEKIVEGSTNGRRERIWPALLMGVVFVCGILLATYIETLKSVEIGRPFEKSAWRISWWLTPREENALFGLVSIRVSLNDVSFVSANLGWAVGEGGTIVKTSDGGRTWARQNSETRESLRSAYFTSTRTGWVTGAKGTILATSDGGETWKHQTGLEGDIIKVQFANARTGWACERGGKIYGTSNGGQDWKILSDHTLVYTPSLKDNINSEQSYFSGTEASSFFFANEKSGWSTQVDGTIWQTRDGGGTWFLSFQNHYGKLNDIFFIDEQRGWAVGDKGLLFATSNGGREWTLQSSTYKGAYRSIRFVDGLRGYAVGDDGTVSRTENGGDTWETGSTGTSAHLSKVVGLGLSLWAVGEAGTIVRSDDAGHSWYPQSQGKRTGFQRALPVNGKVWVVGADGGIFHTADDGITWHHSDSGVLSLLRDIAFDTSGTRGYAVGDGAALESKDGGATWRPLAPPVVALLRTVRFFPPSSVTIASSDGVIQTSQDFGATWRSVGNHPGYVNNWFLSGPLTGCAVGNLGSVGCTKNGGISWETPLTRATSQDLLGIFLNEDEALAFGRGGALERSTDGGETWKLWGPSTEQTFTGYDSDAFGHAILSGSGGLILTTSNGGKTWERKETGTQQTIYDVKITGAETDIAVGESIILKSTDAGETWSDAKYARYPAPWLYAAWCVIGLICWLLYRGLLRVSYSVTAPGLEGIAGKLSSDAPLGPYDYDALNHTEIALGLSEFLRNIETNPGITIAVTGEWGMGKSSVMNLLRSELTARKVCTAWFNAWHHQKEESMLAVLLEAVRDQCAPSLWTPWLWLRFHARLLLLRWRLHPIKGGLLLFILCLTSLTVTRPELSFRLGKALTILGEFAEGKQKWVTLWEEVDAGTGLLISAVLSVLVVWNLLRAAPQFLFAFPLSPARLLATLAGEFKPHEAEKQTTFRNEFAAHLDTVTLALGPRWPTVFIDDLDRCAPEKALEVLEGVNYLVTNGKCFVILAVARERVERLIGLASDKLALETIEKATQAEISEPEVQLDDRARRLQYARQYLEKLFNIEISVPRVGAASWPWLVEQPSSVDSRNSFDRVVYKAIGHRDVIAASLFACISLAVAALLSGTVGNYMQGSRQETSTVPMRAHVQAVPVQTASVASSVFPSSTNEKPADVKSSGLPLSPVEQSHTRVVRSTWLELAAILIAVFLLVARQIVKLAKADIFTYQVRDGNAFTSALLLWQPVVTAVTHSPRGWKRFVNRTRYLAMRTRVRQGQRLRPTVVLLAFLGFRKARELEADSRDTALDEDYARWTVGLAAIHFLNPRLLDNALLFKATDYAKTDVEANAWEFVEAHENPIDAVKDIRAEQEFIERVTVAVVLDKIISELGNGHSWPPPPEFVKMIKEWIGDLDFLPKSRGRSPSEESSASPTTSLSNHKTLD